MSETPERIWMDPDIKFPECEKQYGSDVEYVRADLFKELEAKLAKAVSRLNKLAYWLDIDQELWDAFTVMEKSDHRHMQSEVQAIKDILS